MTVPRDWLTQPTTIAEVEEQLAAEMTPELWLEQWRFFIGQIGPRDELWEYFAWLQSDLASDTWETGHARTGYALVRDGEVIDAIGTDAWS
jgi:hypothetical protein